MGPLCKHEALLSKTPIKKSGHSGRCLSHARTMDADRPLEPTAQPANQNEQTPGILKNPVSKEIRWKVIEEDSRIAASDFHMYSTLHAT